MNVNVLVEELRKLVIENAQLRIDNTLLRTQVEDPAPTVEEATEAEPIEPTEVAE
ncbi:MAG: hypothetical protein FWF25_06225 [Propionibacteriaceae bacterium]|nr:hypothetical protein [Propionibacteriaceae bacterium]